MALPHARPCQAPPLFPQAPSYLSPIPGPCIWLTIGAQTRGECRELMLLACQGLPGDIDRDAPLVRNTVRGGEVHRTYLARECDIQVERCCLPANLTLPRARICFSALLPKAWHRTRLTCASGCCPPQVEFGERGVSSPSFSTAGKRLGWAPGTLRIRKLQKAFPCRETPHHAQPRHFFGSAPVALF